jgi:hypothetical protein
MCRDLYPIRQNASEIDPEKRNTAREKIRLSLRQNRSNPFLRVATVHLYRTWAGSTSYGLQVSIEGSNLVSSASHNDNQVEMWVHNIPLLEAAPIMSMSVRMWGWGWGWYRWVQQCHHRSGLQWLWWLCVCFLLVGRPHVRYQSPEHVCIHIYR